MHKSSIVFQLLIAVTSAPLLAIPMLAAVKFLKMDCQKIESIINDLKVDSLGRIRGKNKVIDKIHAEHLKKVDSDLMDIRVYVAKLSTGHSATEALKMIDEFIYKMSVA